MSAPKYSAEFTEQVVLEIIQRSRPVAEVARSYGLVPQTVGNWVAKWRTEHPEPGAENSSSEENAEIRRLKAELREARMEAEPLEESGGLLRSGVPVSTKYGFIRSEEGNYPVRSMCRWAKVSRSGYYAWRDRPGSATAKRRQDLTVIIARFFADSDQTYGYRRIRAELARHGIRAGAQTVRKIMAANGMTPCQPRKKARTTVQSADLPGRPDRLRRNFTANAPAVTWVGDITYIPTWQGVRLVWPRSRGCIWQENRRPRPWPVTCVPD